MTVGAFLIVGGILLLNAAIRDESVVTIISDLLSNKNAVPISQDTPGGGNWQSGTNTPISPAAYQLGNGQAGPILP